MRTSHLILAALMTLSGPALAKKFNTKGTTPVVEGVSPNKKVRLKPGHTKAAFPLGPHQKVTAAGNVDVTTLGEAPHTLDVVTVKVPKEGTAIDLTTTDPAGNKSQSRVTFQRGSTDKTAVDVQKLNDKRDAAIGKTMLAVAKGEIAQDKAGRRAAVKAARREAKIATKGRKAVKAKLAAAAAADKADRAEVGLSGALGREAGIQGAQHAQAEKQMAEMMANGLAGALFGR